MLHFFSGCATVPMGTEAEKQAAVSFSPPPGMANVYIIRREAGFGAAILSTASIDNQMVGGVQTGSFIYRTVSPGPHTVSVFSNENQRSLPFNAEAGQNYYFDVQSAMGLMSARFVIHPMLEAKGKVAVERCKITAHL
jgi:Protein of unknown function (DUF2846)